MSTTREDVAFEVSEGIGRITLQRPEQGNALGLSTILAFARAVDGVLAYQPRVIVLQAQGRMFCAGGDISEFVAAGDDVGTLIDAMLAPLHPAVQKLHEAPVPVVALVQGAVAGAGIGVALCADFVLAAQSVKLRTGYAAIGLSPDAGASYHLARRVGPVRAAQWFMLSDAVDAASCLQHGAFDALHPDEQLAAAGEALAQRLAQAAPGSLAAIKALCGGPQRGLAEHLALEHRLLSAQARRADAREGVRAFAEKRAPRFGSGD